MSVEMKLGRWQATNGGAHNVTRLNPKDLYPWQSENGLKWMHDGSDKFGWSHTPGSLIRYLGPVELSPTPACADQAGTPVVSPVSTETAGEQLQRMRDRFVALQREVRIYSALLPELERAMSDLEERIKAMEKEAEG